MVGSDQREESSPESELSEESVDSEESVEREEFVEFSGDWDVAARGGWTSGKWTTNR
jgi:hypothetical protein